MRRATTAELIADTRRAVAVRARAHRLERASRKRSVGWYESGITAGSASPRRRRRALVTRWQRRGRPAEGRRDAVHGGETTRQRRPAVGGRGAPAAP